MVKPYVKDGDLERVRESLRAKSSISISGLNFEGEVDVIRNGTVQFIETDQLNLRAIRIASPSSAIDALKKSCGAHGPQVAANNRHE